MPLHPYHGASPEVHPNSWIAPGAHVIGDVHLAEGASIWYGAVLRGDVCSISIGRYSNVQDNSVFHAESAMRGEPCTPCIVGEYVTIGHACVVHGCVIEDKVIVGMGAVVMNHARVGTESMLGAKTLVSERKDIPARSLVIGVPGKVIRAVSEQELAFIPFSAEHYWELAQWHRDEA